MTRSVLDDLPAFPFRAVATSDAVSNEKPLGAIVGDRPVVLWRSTDGTVHALEDRCPHRRAPLSLGCIKGNDIQCGYHGWKLDGTGQIVDIPQLRESKKLPSVYSAQRFAVTEAAGLVFVAVEDGAHAESAKGVSFDDSAYDSHASNVCLLNPERILEILLDGPHLLFEISGIHFSEYPYSDPEMGPDGILRYSRGSRKSRGRWPDRFRSDFPYALHVEIDIEKHAFALSLRDEAEHESFRAVVALTPTRRGTTSLHWRSGGNHAFKIISAPDAAAVEVLLKDMSHRIFEIDTATDATVVHAA